MKKIGIYILLAALSLTAITSYADDTQLHPVKWKGKKWEYLAEYPADIRHIDTVRFEEIMDTAGHHGWRLVTVTHAFHHYTFIFERPLLPEKLKKHRARLKKIKDLRASQEAAALEQIKSAHHERLKAEEAIENQLKTLNQELKQEIQEQKQLEKK